MPPTTPTRGSARSDQGASRSSGSVVLSIGAAVLMIICLVVVIILAATQNYAPGVPKSEADGRGQLPGLMEQMESSYTHLSPPKLQLTHTMKLAQERDGIKIRKFLDQSSCTNTDEDEDSNCTITGTVCDCTSRGLTQVPTSLAEVVQCTTLLLGHNCLRTLPPDAFANFTELEVLDLGYNLISILDDSSFQSLPKLQTLNISHCHLTDINVSDNTFYGLNSLVTLDISWNEKFSITNVLTLLGHLSNETILKHLNISHVTPYYAQSTSISGDQVQALPKGLEKITAQGNGFESIDGDVFEMLPQNLKYLDISDNRFVFGAYLANMSLMANLETFLLNGADVVYNVPTSYPSSKPSECSATFLPLSESGNGNEKLVFQLPPKLKLLSMIKAGLGYRLTEISVNSSNSLEELNLDQNMFSSLAGPLYGLHKLTSLSMKGCFIESINETFFRNLTSLERLDLSCNQIGLDIPSDGNVSLFKDLVHLKYLNLSFNSIPEMNKSGDFLKGLENLEELYIQRNQLWNFNMDITHLYKLRVLNLSHNFLSSLDSEVTSFIHNLVMTSNTSIQVDLSWNSLKCDCSNLDFLRWMSSSKALNESLSTNNMYVCVRPQFNAFTIVHDSYVSITDHLNRDCMPRYGIFCFSIFGTLLLTSIVLGLIFYRFRWNLRYLYYAAYLSVTKGGRPVVIEEDYPYDVFLSYARPDEQYIVDTLCPALEARGLKLHVHGRDFVAGDYIASNIVTAVKESRKTLVVLTHALLESTWCNYEIQMANMESVHSGRPVLIFLIKEPVSNSQLGHNLLSHIRNNTYIPYPEAGPAQEPGNHLLEAFWDKLAADLKS